MEILDIKTSVHQENQHKTKKDDADREVTSSFTEWQATVEERFLFLQIAVEQRCKLLENKLAMVTNTIERPDLKNHAQLIELIAGAPEISGLQTRVAELEEAFRTAVLSVSSAAPDKTKLEQRVAALEEIGAERCKAVSEAGILADDGRTNKMNSAEPDTTELEQRVATLEDIAAERRIVALEEEIAAEKHISALDAGIAAGEDPTDKINLEGSAASESLTGPKVDQSLPHEEMDECATDPSRILPTGKQGCDFIFPGSVWSLAFVMGNAQASLFDTFLAALMFMVSIGIQLVFSYIVSSDSFLGDAFVDEVENAQAWRRTVAHDQVYRDLAGRSLASRVCQGDGSLIVSNVQSDLISNINSFLKLSRDPADEYFLKSPSVQPGIVLSMLCIFLWILAILRELRESLSFAEAVVCMPKLWHTKFSGGLLEGISWARGMVLYSCSFVRTSLAIWLLVKGVDWLANTTSIQDLILNAIALAAILDVDEMVFSAMVPKHFQIVIEHLEAVHVTYSFMYKQIQSVAMFILTPSILIMCYFFRVRPLGEDMMKVKASYCDGNLDFVFGTNTATEFRYAVLTKKYQEEDDITMSQQAVQDLAFKRDLEHSMWIKYTKVLPNYAEFRKKLGETWEEFSTAMEYQNEFFCQDMVFDGIRPQDGAWDLMNKITGIFSKECSDFNRLCDSKGASLVRFTCPETCGCHDPYSNRIFRTPAFGCVASCSAIASAIAAEMPCRDSHAHPSWINFWESFFNYVTEDWPESAKNTTKGFLLTPFLENGCSALQSKEKASFLNVDYCEGGKEFAGLAAQCPVSCQCLKQRSLNGTHDIPSCPQSCTVDSHDHFACYDDEAAGRVNCTIQEVEGGCQTHPTEAEKYCRATCGFCCADKGLPPESGFTCESAKSSGLCQSRPADAKEYCLATCGLCTNTTPV